MSLFFLIGMFARSAEVAVANAAEIAAAAAKATPGGVLVMRDGIWADADIVLRAQGEAARPITLRAATPGAVVLTGSSRLRIAGRHLIVEGLWFKDGEPSRDVIEFRESSKAVAADCVLRQCAITGYNPTDAKTECRWVSLYGANNTVESCYLAGKRNAGATLVVWVDPARPNGHRITRNHFGPRPPLGRNGGETIRVGDSKISASNSRTLVEGNLFERCDGEMEIVSNKSCENVYRGNTFLECAGTLTFRHGRRCSAEGNFFLGRDRPRTGGVRIIDADHRVVNNYFADLAGEEMRSALTMVNGRENSALNGYFPVRGAVVAFNTFVNCRSNFLVGQPDGRETLAPEDCTIVNNVVQSSVGPLLKIVTEPSRFVWQANVFFGATAGLEIDGVAARDPGLAPAADGLWRPVKTSPLVDAAVATILKTDVDMDGQPRPARGADIGADEISDAPIMRRPLAPQEVGPAWLPPAARKMAL